MAGSNISKVEVSGKEFPIIEFKGERILTFAMIDKMHGRPEGTARKRFSDNSERFVEGKHFHLIDNSQKSVFRTFGINVPNRGLIGLAERGYLLLVKSFNDEKSWEVQEHLIDGYFRSGAANMPPKAVTPLLEDASVSYYIVKRVGGKTDKEWQITSAQTIAGFVNKFYPTHTLILKNAMMDNLGTMIKIASSMHEEIQSMEEVVSRFNYGVDAYFARAGVA